MQTLNVSVSGFSMLCKPQGVTWLLMDWNSLTLWCIIFKVYEDDWCNSDLDQIEGKTNKTIES